MRVQVKPSALISFAVIAFSSRLLLGTWLHACEFAVLIALSLLLHEFGHALVARSHGVAVQAIGLSLAGAYTVRSKSARRRIELQTAVAGPLVNVVLALAFACIPSPVCHFVATANLVLAVTNLVPIAPSDGWRIWALLSSSPR